MIRVILWAVIAWVVVTGLRRLLAAGKPDANAAAAAPAPEQMVRCAVCNLNVPRSEAIAIPVGWACCPEHAQTPSARP